MVLNALHYKIYYRRQIMITVLITPLKLQIILAIFHQCPSHIMFLSLNSTYPLYAKKSLEVFHHRVLIPNSPDSITV